MAKKSSKKSFDFLPIVSIGLIALAIVSFFFAFVNYEKETDLILAQYITKASFNGFDLMFGRSVSSQIITDEVADGLPFYTEIIPEVLFCVLTLVLSLGATIVSWFTEGKKGKYVNIAIAVVLTVALVLNFMSYNAYFLVNGIEKDLAYSSGVGNYLVSVFIGAAAASQVLRALKK